MILSLRYEQGCEEQHREHSRKQTTSAEHTEKTQQQQHYNDFKITHVDDKTVQTSTNSYRNAEGDGNVEQHRIGGSEHVETARREIESATRHTQR